MVPLKTALDGVLAFALNDVIPSMPNGSKKFLSYLAVGALKTDPTPVLKPYEGFLKKSGIMSEDGTAIDEAKLSKALADAFASMPTVDFLGFTFSADDAARLASRITKGQ
jgi:hypothetical protein